MSKWLKSCLLLLCAAAALITVLLVPAAQENTYGNVENNDTLIRFSQPSGFYDEPFYLKIKAPSRDIYYTLDGSEPTRDSLRYTGPIYISDATENENVISARTDVSCDSVTVPAEKVDKCTVIRARYYDAVSASPVITASYFVGFRGREGYGTIRVVSLVTDPAGLFDPEDGIYVKGNFYGESEDACDITWTGNYYQRGKDWERVATAEFFDPDGQLFYSTPCGIRIRGNYSRRDAQKSFNLFSRKEYGGTSTFRYDFWGTGYYPDVMSLNSGGNDHIGMIRNRLVSELTSDLDFATMHYSRCHLFLNGEYWGIYEFSEKYNARYISHYYGVTRKNVESVRSRELSDGTSIEDFYTMLHYVETTDLTQSENYAHCWELLDKQSLLEYYATMLYCARFSDWPVKNTQLWRCVTPEQSEYGDGKWRYMLYDMDSPGLQPEDVSRDTIATALETSAFFRSLFQNESFRRELGNMILRIGREVLSTQRVSDTIDRYQAEMRTPMKLQLARYFNADDETLFLESTEDTRTFFNNRLEAITEILRSYDMLPE